MRLVAKLTEWLELKMQKSLGINIFKKLCFVIPVFQCSCTPVSPEDEALNRFSSAFSKEIESEYGFQTWGVGGSIPVKIEDISLCFMANYPTNIEQARRIVVPITLKFIQRMNEDKILMKYLANSPASLKNIDLVISFKETFKGSLESVMITGSRNLVAYKKFNEERTMMVNLHRETFDQAESILRQEGR